MSDVHLHITLQINEKAVDKLLSFISGSASIVSSQAETPSHEGVKECSDDTSKQCGTSHEESTDNPAPGTCDPTASVKPVGVSKDQPQGLLADKIEALTRRIEVLTSLGHTIPSELKRVPTTVDEASQIMMSLMSLAREDAA